MKLRTKMFCLIAVVFAGFLVSTLMGLGTVKAVRVGGDLYGTIKENKVLLERLALLKADLNLARAESLNLILEIDADKILNIEKDLEELMGMVDSQFDEILLATQVEEKQIALQDAQSTWAEFEATLRTEIVAGIHAGDREGSQTLVNGIQKMRYQRFIDQIGGLAEIMALEIEDLEAQAATVIRQKMITSAMTSGIIFLVVVVVTLLLSRSITRPVLQGAAFAEAVAGGDLTQTLSEGSRDETGNLTRALNTMVTGLNGMVGRVSRSAEELDRISRNIYETSTRVTEAAQMQAESVDSTSSAITEINSSIREVGQGIDSLSGLASENTASVMEMAASIDEVAGNVEVLAKAVEEVGASIAEMAASIRQVSGNAGNLQDAAEVTASSIAEMDYSIKQVEEGTAATVIIAEEVRRDAETGKSAADSAMLGMHEIRRAAQTTAEVVAALSGKADNIGNILSVINDVVDQINLLALNAAIIAAQAGDKGRSFAVVAEEIRELANRTGGSSQEISKVIKDVQEETRRAVQSINAAEKSVAEGERLSQQSGEALLKIVTGVEKTTQQMGDVSRATKEQARSSQMIRKAMERVSEMVAQIAAATRQQSQASEQIMVAAERMKGLTGEVRSSTREQSKAGGSIARASEEMTGMIRQIKRACDEQTRGSEQIGRAIEDIQGATAVNLDSTQVMEGAVTGLRQQTQVLQKEMEAFRTLEG